MTSLDKRIPRQLRQLGAGIRLRLVLKGLGWAVTAAFLAAMVSLAVDCGLYRLTLQHMTVLQRAFINGLCLAVVLLVAWRHLVRGMAQRFSEADLALVVENANPALQDRLVSALQFTRPGALPRDASEQLVAKVVDEANALAGQVRFRSVLRSRVTAKALAWAGVCLLAGALFVLARPDVARPWFERNVLLQNVSYPKRTALRVEGGSPIRVVRGGTLEVTVIADPERVVPAQVVFHMRFPSLGDTSETVKPHPEERHRFVKAFPVVSEPFTFTVSGNDDRTEEIRVELVEPPALEDLDFTVRSPVYTLKPPARIHRSQGSIDVPEDSTIAFRAVATKDLASAAVLLDGRPAGRCSIRPTPGAAPRVVEGELVVTAPEPFRPRLNLQIVLKDRDGFENARAASYSLVLIQDEAPVLQLEAIGMGGQITSKATVPLAVAATDDYGVSEIHLEWAVQSSPESVQRYVVQGYVSGLPEPPPLGFNFDLEQMRALATSNTPPLQVGETIRIQAAAVDTFPAPRGPHRTMSNLVTLRIVTEDEVLSTLVDSQRAMREQVRQVIAMQTEVRDRTRGAVAHTARATTLALAYREVAACTDLQGQIKDQLGGVTSRLEGLLRRLRNNRIVASADERRLENGVIAPLNDLQANRVVPLVASLEAAKALNKGSDLGAELTELARRQDELIQGLEQVLAEMIKVENAQRVERGLRTIIRLSDKVRGMMKEPAKKEDNPDDTGDNKPGQE